MRVVMSDTLFVPHWEVPEPRGDLRAPLFRENGIAIDDQGSASSPANDRVPAASVEAGIDPEAPVDGPDARDAGPDRGDRAAGLIGPAGPAGSRRDAGADGTGPARDAPSPGRGQVVKGEAPESTGTRSVVIACAIGAFIAAAIIWAALLLRPASAEDAPRAPGIPDAEMAAAVAG